MVRLCTPNCVLFYHLEVLTVHQSHGKNEGNLFADRLHSSDLVQIFSDSIFDDKMKVLREASVTVAYFPVGPFRFPCCYSFISTARKVYRIS